MKDFFRPIRFLLRHLISISFRFLMVIGWFFWLSTIMGLLALLFPEISAPTSWLIFEIIYLIAWIPVWMFIRRLRFFCIGMLTEP